MSEVVSKTIKKHLRCELTPKEVETFGREIAQELAKLAAAEEKKTEVAAQIKAEVESHKNKALALTRLINNGYEYRDIECTATMNYAQGLYIVVRDDTLEEVENRALTAEERQIEIAQDETEATSPHEPSDMTNLNETEGEDPADETKDPDYPEDPDPDQPEA